MKNLLRLHALLISMLLDDSGDSDSDSGDSDSDSGGWGDASLSSFESAEFSDSNSSNSGGQQQAQVPPVRPEDLNQLNLGDIPPQWDPNNLPSVPPPGDIQPPGDWPDPKA